MPTTPLLRLEKVSRNFDDGAVVALDSVDLSIPAGDCLAIVGASGSGKSSLINMMSGIDAPSSGTVYWRDKPISSRREWNALRANEIGIVFQEFNLLGTLTALENVEMALFGRGITPAARHKRAIDALTRVGLAARLDHQPHALSGGERQRVAIARSVVNTPKLLLADEPTGNLDSENCEHIADLLIDLQRTTGATLIFVTHDEELACRCKHIIRIRDGRIVADVASGVCPPVRKVAP